MAKRHALNVSRIEDQGLADWLAERFEETTADMIPQARDEHRQFLRSLPEGEWAAYRQMCDAYGWDQLDEDDRRRYEHLAIALMEKIPGRRGYRAGYSWSLQLRILREHATPLAAASLPAPEGPELGLPASWEVPRLGKGDPEA